MEEKLYESYLNILREELLPAMGCTEPIAIAYGAAKAREVLGSLPEKVLVEASGNIIKNVKSVIVPNTGGMKGIETACAAGMIAGKAEKKLEVISQVSEEQVEQIRVYLEKTPISVVPSQSPLIFDLTVRVWAGNEEASVRIANYHTNLVSIEKNGRELLEPSASSQEERNTLTDRSLLDVEHIVAFADTVPYEKIRDLVGRQIEYNMKIAEEGMRADYGANVGKVLREYGGGSIKNRAKAMAAAASDARMDGCELPVIIVSGSGNQGITASVPVVEYGRALCASPEKICRAVALSDLITIHQKTGIGRLSAYCGAVSAGCGAGAGIAYLKGGSYKEIAHTVVNSVAVLSGMICDGAKASCAAKIAMAVEAGIFGYEMYEKGQQFKGGDGIVSKGVENTIMNIGRLAREGMKETDKEILEIMTRC